MVAGRSLDFQPLGRWLGAANHAGVDVADTAAVNDDDDTPAVVVADVAAIVLVDAAAVVDDAAAAVDVDAPAVVLGDGVAVGVGAVQVVPMVIRSEFSPLSFASLPGH